MAWLAVDKNNDECIFEDKPNLNRWGYWECMISYEGEMVNMMIDLPKGTIKKLIGKELTWEDEPVELLD